MPSLQFGWKCSVRGSTWRTFSSGRRIFENRYDEDCDGDDDDDGRSDDDHQHHVHSDVKQMTRGDEKSPIVTDAHD